jgi:hypothetical protein
MPRHKVFVSYSHTDKSFCDELVLALEADPSIGKGKVLWFDQQGIDIGEKFHSAIQQALAESSVAILLLSNRFFTSRRL